MWFRGILSGMRVLIVGSGIAGLACAHGLLHQGARVTVIEKQSGPIDRVCGEGILPFGVSLLHDMGLEQRVRAAGRSFGGITYLSGTRQVSADFESGTDGIAIGRGHLDAILRETCLANRDFTHVAGRRAVPEDARGFDRVLVADGIHARWGRALGRRVRHGRRLGLRFRVAAEPLPRVTVRFCKGHEIYLTPTGPSTQSVAFLIDRDRFPARGKMLRERCLQSFRDAFPRFSDHPVSEIATRGPISSRPRHQTTRVHLLGDAFRAFDPITGAGMSFALLCAAKAVAHIEDVGAYNRALRPHVTAIGDITETVLFFRGGGWRTDLMLRQLMLAPRCLRYLLSCHDGRHRLRDLHPARLLPLLRPF